MDDFLRTAEDFGGVHTNSSIHNKAAFNLMTARDGEHHLFTPEQSAALFYLALTNHLSRTSRFRDSRRAVELVAKSLFRNDPQDLRDTKLAAIGAAFDAVGIPPPQQAIARRCPPPTTEFGCGSLHRGGAAGDAGRARRQSSACPGATAQR